MTCANRWPHGGHVYFIGICPGRRHRVVKKWRRDREEEKARLPTPLGLLAWCQEMDSWEGKG